MRTRFLKPKLFFITTFLLLVSHVSTNAQNDFRPGYYITWENDTINGLIDYRGEIRNSRICEFKADRSSSTEKFKPEEVKAYRFSDSKYYVSKKIKIEEEPETQYFLEMLVDGIYNLYFMQTGEKEYFFIESEEGMPVSLYKKYETVFVEGKGEMLKEYSNHVALMKSVFADCEEIQPQINNTQLSHKSLINITRKYHDYMCDDQECIVYEKSLSKVKILISPVIGFNQSSLSLDDGFFSNMSYDNCLTPNLGLLAEAVFPRTNDKLSVQFETVYGTNDFYGIYRGYYEVFFESSFIQPSLAIKYTLPGKILRPSLAIGGLGMLQFSNEANAKIYNENLGTTKEIVLSDFPIKKQLKGVFAQVGCNIKVTKHREMFLHLRYIIRTGYYRVEDDLIVGKINSFNINAGFYLNKTQ